MRLFLRTKGARRVWVGAGTGIVVAGLVAVAWAAPESRGPEPRETMHEIFARMTELIPLLLDEEAGIESQQERAAALIDELVQETDALEAHGRARDADFRFLARSLSVDLEEAKERLERGQPRQARFFAALAVESCVQCHSRVPKARDFPLAERLTKKVSVESLPLQERALFQVATRSFDAALTSWEHHFALPSTGASHLATDAELEQYLQIAISVQRDPERARTTLGALAARPDADAATRRRLELWSAELGRLSPVVRGPASVDEARSLLGLPDPPIDSDLRRIREFAARALLLRVIDGTAATRENAATLGEAYYLLGTAEARSHQGLWHPQTQFHLETAIRIHPEATWARDALDLFAETVTLGHTGSAGTHLPSSYEAKIAELDGLVTRAAAKRDENAGSMR